MKKRGIGLIVTAMLGVGAAVAFAIEIPAQPGEEFGDSAGGVVIDMVVVGAGNFQMGSPDDEGGRADREGPQKTIVLQQPFALSRTEITVGQFRAFVEATGHVTDAEKLGKGEVFDTRNGKLIAQDGATWQQDFSGEPATDELPVLRVSWNDAQAFIEWLSAQTGATYRLPSESEFEYALRAGTTSRYWWGEAAPERPVENLTGSRERLRSLRWPVAFRNYSDRNWGPAPVGSFEPNPFGLYDMGGNVAEWVEDCYVGSLAEHAADGSAHTGGECERRVFRGATWAYPPPLARSAYRNAATAEHASAMLGFRVARDLLP